MKLYTKQGDEGFTRLGNGTQVRKDSLVINALGTIDELNACLGIISADCSLSSEAREVINRVQHELFNIGAEVCVSKSKFDKISDSIKFLEERIDYFDGENEPLKKFILPGGNKNSAWLHYARTICRKAERELVNHFNSLEKDGISYNKNIIIYLNRLSDLLFAMARHRNDCGKCDVVWKNS